MVKNGTINANNRAKVYAINHLGTQYIAEAAKAVDAKMVYISTDYVFDGQGERPWQPDDKNKERFMMSLLIYACPAPGQRFCVA